MQILYDSVVVIVSGAYCFKWGDQEEFDGEFNENGQG